MADHDHYRPRSQGNGSGISEKKRKHEQRGYDSMGHTLSLLRQPDLPEFNLTSARRPSQDEDQEPESPKVGEQLSEGWQTVQSEHPKKKAKKVPKANSSNYPSIKFSHTDSRLQSQVKISDIQNLVLYILADGPSPQFVSVRHRPEIRKVVVLMVPGLEKSMFVEEKKKQEDDRRHSPEDYYPILLKAENLPAGLEAFADMFEDLWPVKTPGDDKFGKMHSPLHAILTAPLPKDKQERSNKKNNKGGGGVQQAREPAGWKNSRTLITEFVHTPEELLENDYTLHPAAYGDAVDESALATHRNSAGVLKENGWVDTLVKKLEDGSVPDNEIEQGSLTAGREIFAMDCEMCMTGENEFSLTRISLVGLDGSVVLDELVKPAKPITNYLTQYSGITEQMLESVTTTLEDIQKKLLDILHPRTILVGHSLNSDLTALKLTHPFIIDTALIYPHPRGPPLKSSLKWLAQKYLNREIQKGHGTTGPGAGHDSIEDARTCLDLVKQKCEKGRDWGTSDSAGENIFKRIARTGVKYKNQGGSAIPSPINGRTTAMVDWGDPKKGAGAAATHVVGCKSDEDVVEAVIRAVNGDPDGKEIPGGGVDFVFGRLRELEALKGWWNNNKAIAHQKGNLAEAWVVATEVMTSELAPAEAEAETTNIPKVELIVGEARTAPAETSYLEATGEEVDVEMKDKVSSSPPLGTPAIDEGSTSTSHTSQPILSESAATSLSTLTSALSSTTATLTTRLQKIHASLPPCTAFIIYSGSGDPREMSRLQAMQAQFKREYRVRKWDELSVRWTDVEEQALRRAVGVARSGIAFLGVR